MIGWSVRNKLASLYHFPEGNSCGVESSGMLATNFSNHVWWFATEFSLLLNVLQSVGHFAFGCFRLHLPTAHTDKMGYKDGISKLNPTVINGRKRGMKDIYSFPLETKKKMKMKVKNSCCAIGSLAIPSADMRVYLARA